MTAATVLKDGLGFGDGPRWRDGLLWFSDLARVEPDGTLGNARVWASTAPQMAAPEGLCADPEGGIWAATALQPKVIRYAEGGEVTGEVETSQITYVVALGGAHGRTLLAMTAPTSDPAVVDGQALAKVDFATVA